MLYKPSYLEKMKTKGVSPRGLDTNSHSHRHCVIEHLKKKIWTLKTLVRFPGRQYSEHCHTLWSGGGNATQDPKREGQLEAPHLDPSLTLLYESLSLVNVNLYPLPVINHEYSSQ